MEAFKLQAFVFSNGCRLQLKSPNPKGQTPGEFVAFTPICSDFPYMSPNGFSTNFHSNNKTKRKIIQYVVKEY
jgi:hypothetical protein